MYAKYIKRLIDIIVSFFGIILLSPLFLILIILGAIMLKGKPFFVQERPGMIDTKTGKEKIIKLIKFCTMLPPQTKDGRILTDAERLECIANNIDVLSDEERLNKYGRILRATSLDEIPELFNILKGDMSIVGPRPLAVIYLPYYTPQERKRHNVRPGLTGLAQVNGRNSASWEKRFEYDIEYVDNMSLLNDIKIIIKTISVVLKREDIGQGAEAPEAFNVVRQRELDEIEINR